MPDETLLAPFLSKLEARDRLSPEERQLLIGCAEDIRDYPAGSDLVREGDRPDVSLLIVDGFTSRYRDMRDGTRHITSIHVPGDFVDLHSLLIRDMDHSVGALSNCRMMRFPHSRLRELSETAPHLTRLLWLMTLIDGSIHREWLAAASRSAPEQIAHLICELYVRLGLIGMVEPDNSFNLPLTQVEIGEALGLSAVHVNRSLQHLRGEELFSWHSHQVRILNWDALRERASFDDRYLHLVQEPR
ncbi:MAG TPA: Crp/Fnr family transcriptional regulator [Devosia sp.]|jgi:CRP-like cAMP-binding protein|nr:Crp/Fnr family transcriptional regulator [Devosia sp.]